MQTDSPRPPAHTPAIRPRAHWTPAKQRIFLAALLECGSVVAAARAAGMSRSSAHRLRLRLAGTPFVAVWDAALAEHARRLGDPFGPAPTPAPAPPAGPAAAAAAAPPDPRRSPPGTRPPGASIPGGGAPPVPSGRVGGARA